MAKKLALVNGIPRMTDESSSLTIYDQTLLVVNSGGNGTTTINESDVQTGDEIALPNGETYVSNELEVYLNGERIAAADDYNYVGSGTRTKISMAFDCLTGDKLRFRIDRSP
jgi:hypothetical protein